MTTIEPGQLAAKLAAARAEEDGERRMALVVEAATAGSEAVLAQVRRLLASAEVVDQVLGADLAGTMSAGSGEEMLRWAWERGIPLRAPTPFALADRAAAAELLLAVLVDSAADPDAVDSAIVAAGKLDLHELAHAVALHASDADDDVRASIGFALSSLVPEDRERKVAALLALARDPVDEVRSWALLALRWAVDDLPLDTPEALAVYRANAEDPDEEVRVEAVMALGLLGDVEMLIEVFDCFAPDRDCVELALRIRDQRLHGPLLRLRERERVDGRTAANSDFIELVDEAILACAPSRRP